MNEISQVPTRQNGQALQSAATADDAELIRVLQNSLYPGAKAESVALVISYCRVNQVDPMLKPVHIVPTNVKVGPNHWEIRDVLMPGIADYRIKAARSGQYAGMSEPEFGPEVITVLGNQEFKHPEWCKITVYRLVGGEPRPFPAKEYWLENYATAKKDTDAPNSMWRKRRYGQLSKCTESQAIRKAFPEFSGGTNTAEEMEGKHLDGGGPVIEGKAEPAQQAKREAVAAEHAASEEGLIARVDGVLRAVAAAPDIASLSKIEGKAGKLFSDLNGAGRPKLVEKLKSAFADRKHALMPPVEERPAAAPAATAATGSQFESEIYLSDGSALEDNGAPVVFSSPVPFAAAIERLCGDRACAVIVVENNRAAIEVACDMSADAARILQPLLDGKGETSPAAGQSPLTVSVPKANGAVKVQEYVAACRQAILILRDDQVDKWREANEPNYRDMGPATKTAIARAFQERHAPAKEQSSGQAWDASEQQAAAESPAWTDAREVAKQFAECKSRGDLDMLTGNAAIKAKVNGIREKDREAGAWLGQQYKAVSEKLAFRRPTQEHEERPAG